MGWQTWIGVGNLGRDAELKTTSSDQTVVSFSMAVTESWRDRNGQKQEKTLWARVSVWGKAGEAVRPYLTKGKQVLVEGTAGVRAYAGRDGNPGASFEVRASRVQLLGSPSDARPAEAGGGGSPSASASGIGPGTSDYGCGRGGEFPLDDVTGPVADDEDLPF
jgi:single-strand DNA-binding protein